MFYSVFSDIICIIVCILQFIFTIPLCILYSPSYLVKRISFTVVSIFLYLCSLSLPRFILLCYTLHIMYILRSIINKFWVISREIRPIAALYPPTQKKYKKNCSIGLLRSAISDRRGRYAHAQGNCTPFYYIYI